MVVFFVTFYVLIQRGDGQLGGLHPAAQDTGLLIHGTNWLLQPTISELQSY
jgi:hypothetical protein